MSDLGKIPGSMSLAQMLRAASLKYMTIEPLGDLEETPLYEEFNVPLICFDPNQEPDPSPPSVMVAGKLPIALHDPLIWEGTVNPSSTPQPSIPIPQTYVPDSWAAAFPSHYKQHPSGIECIDVVEHLPFNVGNAIKYLWRHDHKGNAIEDLRKAAWYVMREIERREKLVGNEQTEDTAARS